jgi:hypothetical protein
VKEAVPFVRFEEGMMGCGRAGKARETVVHEHVREKSTGKGSRRMALQRPVKRIGTERH